MSRVIEYIRSRPLVVMAPAAITGVVLSSLLAVRWTWTSATVVAAIGLLAIALLVRRWIPVAVFALGLALGFARNERAEYRPPSDVGWAPLPEGRVRVRGTVLDRPRFYSDRASALEETQERHDGNSSGAFDLEILSIEELPGVTGRLRVQFYERPDVRLIGGEELLLAGKIRHPRPQSNPGGADRREILAREGIGAILVVGEKDEWSLLRPPPIASLRTTIEQGRDSLRGALYRHARPDAAALLSALLIGSRENLPEDLVRSLQHSGTAHFLAISGQNMAIVLLLVAVVLTVVGLRGPWQHALTIAILLIYAALSDWQVSVVRAFLMASVWLAAHLVWRRSDAFNSLCAAALALVLADPIQVFAPGFQLSFLAVVGILFIAPVFHDFMAPAPSPERRRWQWVGRWARGTLAISMAAWLITAPVVLANFHLLTPIILVANILLVPLITLETAIAIVLAALAPVAPPLADVVGWCGGLVLDCISVISSALTRLPGSYVFLPALPGWGVAVYYMGLAAWTFWARIDPGGFRPWLCVAFAVGLALPGAGRQRPDGLFVAMIDVGQGCAVYVEWPDGRNLVYDCGSLTNRDVGATVVAPFLWARGIRSVDTIVLSHQDADHTNGAWSLAERLRIRQVILTRYFPQSFIYEAKRRGLHVITVERAPPDPVPIAPGVEVLGPPTWEKYGWEPDSNDSSIVMRIEGRVLLTGDIMDRGSAELIGMGKCLPTAEVLMAPHHGRERSSHRDLAAAVAPRITLVSSSDGKGTSENGACRVYGTWREGCIELTLRPEDIEVRTFLGRSTLPAAGRP